MFCRIFIWGSTYISRVSCQKGPTRHAYAWQIGRFWQETLDISICVPYLPLTRTCMRQPQCQGHGSVYVDKRITWSETRHDNQYKTLQQKHGHMLLAVLGGTILSVGRQLRETIIEVETRAPPELALFTRALISRSEQMPHVTGNSSTHNRLLPLRITMQCHGFVFVI